VSGEAAADAASDLTEGQVDLVVDDEHALEGQPVDPARGSDAAAHVVHEGLGLKQRDRRPAGAGAALAQASAVAVANAVKAPTASELLGDREADVVAGALVFPSRVAEPDDEPVDRRTAREAQRRLLAVV
jgi:hypothetical protein